MSDCPLCEMDGGAVIVRRPNWRVVRVEDALYPGYYRVIWNQHLSEFSDLPLVQRREVMDVVAEVETQMRRHLQPRKINLAALGNMVPHLHWHLIARDADDAHFPQAIWAAAQREAAPELLARWRAGLPALDEALAQRLNPG